MMDRITVVVDTREQEPYSFDSDKVSAVRKALPAGDYSLVGLEERVAVERKSLTDFVSTVIRGRKRFHRELEKLSAYESACVVVECNFRDLVDGRYRSDAHPHALIGTVASIVVDFGVPVYFCCFILPESILWDLSCCLPLTTLLSWMFLGCFVETRYGLLTRIKNKHQL